MYILIAMQLLSTGCMSTTIEDERKKIDTAKAVITATNSKTQFVEVNGRKLAYRSIGKGDPIILCSRFRGNLDSWDPAFLDALAKNFTVVTFNYSGFGSSTGDAPTLMSDFANDIKDLAKALHYDKFILGGWSFGGAVAQVLTVENPELVQQLILIGTRPPGKIAHGFEKIFFEVSRVPNISFEDEIILFFEPAWEPSRKAAKLSHDRIAERMKDPDTRIDEKVWANYSKGFEDYTEDKYQAREKLMKTTIPILVISSDHEICFPPENWFDLNRKLQTTQVITIARTGHGVHHEYPELVSNYITDFIRNHKAAN